MMTFFIFLAVLIAVFLVAALVMKKTYNVHCDIVVNASKEKTYNYLRYLKNQDHFNVWVMAEPDSQKTFTGDDGIKGFIYAWKGTNKAGEGEQEITNLVENELVATEIRFIRPMAGIAYADYKLEVISDNQTKVIWNNKSTMKYPMNLMISLIEKMLEKDMKTSLENLKNILEV
ncbi:SRPBCC family protein [Flavobacterium sp.]|uniref:SRPBCC family protein n=1 Tax=Flavobacterium sp. TaxID=239 RepID=UPI0028BF5594|nr:SRPBCC family protein [Flavobacterium sp.]